MNSVTSGISFRSSERNVNEVSEALAFEEKRKLQRDNDMRYFCTLINNVKKILGQKHMGYYTDNILLFNHAVKEKIPVEQWPDFIMKELNGDPSKWIDPRNLNKVKKL